MEKEEILVLKDVMYCPLGGFIMYTGGDQCFIMDVMNTTVKMENYDSSKPLDKHFFGDLYLIDGEYILKIYHEKEAIHYTCKQGELVLVR
jgi:hypothetical protein